MAFSLSYSGKSLDANLRLRFACIGTLAAVTVVGALVMPGVPIAAALVALAWMVVRALELWWFDRVQRRLAPYPEAQLMASHVGDVIGGTAYVSLMGSGLWFTNTLYLFLVVSAYAALAPRLARLVTLMGIVAYVTLLAVQLTGITPPSPFLGYGLLARSPWVAAASAVAFVVFMVQFATVMSFIIGELRRRTTQHRAVLDTASDIILVVRVDGTVRQGNRAADEAARAMGTDFRADGLGALVVADDLPLADEMLQAAARGEPRTLLLRTRGAPGVRWAAATFAPLGSTRGMGHVLVIMRDVTEERRVAEAVRTSEARLRAVFDQAAVAIALTDPRGVFVEANRAIESLLGHQAPELIGHPWTRFVHADDHAATREALVRLESGEQQSATFEQRFVRRDGRVVWVELTASRAESPDGRAGLVVMMQDITERRALEAQLTWQAYHDPLTNLANRTLFRDRVERALAAAHDQPGSVAVLFLDLDNFKTVNDSLGHAAGDQLLFEVARRLLHATRGCDIVARLGGDEFAILLDRVRTAGETTIVAERVLHAMQAPVLLEGREVIVGASVGIVRAETQLGADELLRDADVAMYDAKQAGKNRYACFEPRMHVRAVERMRLEADLRVAIDAAEFTLVYQPVVRIETGRPVTLEALVRWRHPALGAITPDVFIPIAEETGLIVPLGRWILGEACRTAVRWNAMPGLLDPIGVSVNVSPRQLEEPSIVTTVREVLRETGLAPSLLTLEITETGFVGTDGEMPARLRELKALGVSLAIDDFGTGYSSLGYIQHLPVDVIKIDRLFIEGLKRGSGHEAALARTIVGLGQSLGLRTVAEGIETDAQRAILSEFGCALGQGYLFARPLGTDEILAWLVRALELPDRPGAAVRRRGRASQEMVAVG
ncbi:MAG: EAL domain-containing protein [Gemmatimonadaceae bacterium]|jgi:diguanylate cyclase (GGDEF)-like protein/PAS domain S-box-containing protein|nr:EAL domain-containing protein [Gemmatimonadaceae bacterium]